MQISVESGEGLERRLNVELPAEQVTEAMERRFKQIARTTKMDGFRPGKAPLSIVRRRFKERVKDEVFGELVQSSYFEALNREQLRPAGDPRIERNDKTPEEGMGYTAIFEVMPEVALQPIDQATIKQPVTEVTDVDVDAMIEKLRKQRTTWEKAERAAQQGDRVLIDFKGSVDGEVFEGGSANELPLVLGSGMMIEGFEEGLIGAMAEEDRTLNVKFPDDYRVEKLAGKPAVFEVKVREVLEPVLPELNAELAKALGVPSGEMSDLRQEIRTNMERELRRRVKKKLKDQAMDALLTANQIEVPNVLVEEEADALKAKAEADMRYRAGQGGALQLPRELFMEEAKRRVVLGLVIAEVIKKNEIRLDAERVRKTVEEFASDYDNPQEVIDWYYSNKEQLAMVENLVLEDQVVDWVLGQAKVEEEPTSFSALTENAAEG